MLYGADTGTIANGNDTRTRTNNMRTLMWICGCVEKQRNIISETREFTCMHKIKYRDTTEWNVCEMRR